MNALRKQVMIALAVLSMGGAAFAVQAQTAPAEGRYGHAATQEQRMAKWGEHFAKRQAKLHDLLQLTPAQESAWAAYQSAIRPTAPPAMGARGDWANLSAPARMEKMITLTEQRTATMKSHLGALNTFYSTLTPAQKKVFDANTMGGSEHRGGHHMKGGMHG